MKRKIMRVSTIGPDAVAEETGTGRPVASLVSSNGTVILDGSGLPECRRLECGIWVTEPTLGRQPNRIRVWRHDKVVSCIQGYAALDTQPGIFCDW